MNTILYICADDLMIIYDSKKIFNFLKWGIGIEGEKIMETS